MEGGSRDVEIEAGIRPPAERSRLAAIAATLVGVGADDVLEVGARDGRVTRVLAGLYPGRVTALDLDRPDLGLPGVEEVAGDVTGLRFPDGSFDLIVCTEVLEHVPELGRAAAELMRACRGHLLVGVPYRQDTRVGRMLCRSCGRRNPPNGHVNAFDERRLDGLFAPFRLVERRLVGPPRRERTNPLSAWLMDRAGNPYGPYEGQDEPCVHCGARLVRPAPPAGVRRGLAWASERLRGVQARFLRPRPPWIHTLYAAPPGRAT